jgi:hypothetical protein
MSRSLYRFVAVWLCVTAIAASPIQEALLESLRPSLGEQGISVHTSWLRPLTSSSTQPVVGPLLDYPFSRIDAASHGAFHEGFIAGASHEAALLAVEGGGSQPSLSLQEFRARWLTANKNSRVFVSFTRQDRAYARIVRSSLEQLGYTVFTYLGRSETPRHNSVEVGTFFREAGNHLVIDTPAARRSAGVISEALWIQGESRRPLLVPDWAAPRTPSNASNAICCERCRVVGGRYVNCVSMGCGPQCAGARPNP